MDKTMRVYFICLAAMVVSMFAAMALLGAPPDVPDVPVRNPLTIRIEFKLPQQAVGTSNLAAWLRQPANVGSCPCKATAHGCRCQPHSECARGNCAAHNPLLGARVQPVQRCLL